MPQERSDIARTVDVMGELDHVEVRESPTDILSGAWLVCTRCDQRITQLENGDHLSVLVGCVLQHNRRDCRR